MSDTSQGPGWWQASDGKWYPPEQAPAAAPAPVRFADFGLSPAILRALNEQGYEHPTPIQAQAIPVLLRGRDVMGAAQTGTGKTASFALPIIQMLLPHASASTSPARHPVRALILAPTRELAVQVAENVKAYCKHTPLRATEVFGGMDVLLAHTWNGLPISREHGGPVRVVIPKWYFWKSAKWVTRIVFHEEDKPGFWETRGYHNEGDPWKEQRYS